MKASTVTVKGHVTIPREIRQRLGVRPGDRVRFRDAGAEVVVEKQDGGIEAAFGLLKARKSVTLRQIAAQKRKGWARRARS